MEIHNTGEAINFTDNVQGAVWHRWEPHIHTPGTILNDQYSGNDPWDDFLNRIEQSSPQIKALGITDYYSITSYELVLQKKSEGRLSNIDLIFVSPRPTPSCLWQKGLSPLPYEI